QARQRQLDEVTRQLATNPKDDASHSRRGRLLLYEFDRPADAIDDLTQAINLKANPDTYGLRASAHAAANDYAKAIADVATGLNALAPQDPREGRFRNQLAWYYVRASQELRQPKEAVSLARRALACEPGRAAYLNTLGVALCLSGEVDEALDALG